MALSSAPTSAAARRIIVGTAGHIDHGKTAVVKALTGIDADRLQEEKRRGITVLTKSDAVDAETLEVTRLEVQEFLRGSFLDGAPLVAVSAKTGFGIEELKRELGRVAAEAPLKNSSSRFRLPIDRVFTMKGFGTVITGTLISGAVRKEMELEIFPQKQRARVRGVQVHGVAAEMALAGERTALNLAGPRISTETLARGMTLAEPG